VSLIGRLLNDTVPISKTIADTVLMNWNGFEESDVVAGETEEKPLKTWVTTSDARVRVMAIEN
jgi:hypothetical protein